MSYVCACCGETHDSLPDLAFDKPGYVNTIPKEEWPERVQIDDDLCAVDNEHYFIRAVLLIPIKGQDDHLGFGVWVSQNKDNFLTYIENYDTDEIGPFFGWLSNEFSFGGESTLNLKTMAHFQGNGQRPLIVLEESEHPLSKAQRDGISIDDAWEIAHEFLD